MKTLLITTFSFILILTSFSISETYIPGGYISGTWTTAGSPYRILGDITVHADSTLTIEPGVEVVFQGLYSLQVNGALAAIGTEIDSISFSAADTSEGWRGIRTAATADNSWLSYASIRYGRNTDGGGIYCASPNVTITHCTIADNSASNNGGGVCIFNGLTNPPPVINNCNIIRNYARFGGGVFYVADSMVISECIISNNSAQHSSGEANGGGIFFEGGFSSSINIQNCIIQNNSCESDSTENTNPNYGLGGGLYIHGRNGGGVFISNCQILSNWSRRSGGGIFKQLGGIVITDCIFRGNFTKLCAIYSPNYLAGGGAISFSDLTHNSIITRCEFSENFNLGYAPTGGGAIRAFYNISASLTLENCTFTRNYSTFGYGAIFFNGPLHLKNTIIAFNNSGNQMSAVCATGSSVSYCDFYGNNGAHMIGVPGGFGTLTALNSNNDSCDVYSNIFLDPLFADTSMSNFHLTENSPCIDAGDPLSPLDPDGTVADMGAFYFHQGGTGIPGGYVSGIWTAASSPYRILGDITIHADSALTIEPGVEVVFQGHYRFIINGIINAVGTQTDSIRFTAAIPDTGWRGLRFMTSADTSHLAYCIIEYGKATFGSIIPDRRGGGIYCLNSLPEISHCSIRNNLAEVYGGGICFYNVSNDTIFITDCNITNNRTTGFSGDGGGIYFYGDGVFVEMQNCIVSHNVSTNGNGGGIGFGYLASSNPVLHLNNCTVAYNYADDEGGGIWIESFNWHTLYITQSDISYNTAVNNGGGIHTRVVSGYTGTFIYSSSFIGNEVTGALGNGGAIYGDLGGWPYITKTIENTIIADNQAFEGGGLYLFDSNAYFDKCTIANNTGTTGSGLYFPSSSNIHIKNCILSLNSPAVIHNAAILYLSYSDFYGNGINISGGVPAGFGELVTTNYNGDSCDVAYNIFLDPLFEDPGSSNYQITWTNWPTPDSTKSPCIDAGDPASSLDPDNTISDIGTFYFHQPGSHIQPGYVSGIWLAANSPYIIHGEITIHADSSLTIEPGVEVIFQGHYKFNVEGIIHAVGTESDSIRFTVTDTSVGWRGLRFTNAPDGSQLSYCIIQYGRATVGTHFLDRRGGGIYINTSRPQISHCTISNCYADVYGGGICISAFDFPPITNCNITRNSSNNVGGGIYFSSGPLEISDCNISQNTANGHGGGLYLNCGATDSIHISKCSIREDSTSQFGDGGGIYVTDGYVFINGCTFANNKAGLTGGGLYNGGYLNAVNSTFQGNISWGGLHYYDTGGGGFIVFKSTYIDSCVITDNISHTGNYPSYGGGILFRSTNHSIDITNSKFTNNTADVCGGLMVYANNTTLSYCEISNNQALLGGTGGAQIQSWNSSIDHCTVTENVAASGGNGGLYVNNDASVSNSIFSWNSSIAVSFSSSGTIDYCNFWGNNQDISGNIPSGFGMLDTTNVNGDSCDVYSNIFLDPLFADTSMSDFHLMENSPCIDAGDPASPLDPDSTIADMGAFFFDHLFPIIYINEDSLNFGTVEISAQKDTTFKIFNQGLDTLFINNITSSLSVFTTDFNVVNNFILPDDSMLITVTFTPLDSGFIDDTLIIDNNAQMVEVYLSGIGKTPVGVIDDELTTPKEYALYPAYPNPFNPTTTIKFDLPKTSFVELKVFDVLGKQVGKMISEQKAAGKYKYIFDGSNLASGLYFVQMRADDFHAMQKILLVK